MPLLFPPTRRALLPALFLLSLLAACSRSTFEPAQLAGRAAMVNDAGTPRLWVLTKQEERRWVGTSTGSSRLRNPWRTAIYFHFDLEAFDPATATPLWKQRLRTLGDPEQPGIVIGSSADARLLGQEGELVWLLIDNEPFALHAADGRVVVDAKALLGLNPSLQGRLPSESKFYGFDRGLVVMTADAQQFVVRGSAHTAEPYTPPPPPSEPEGPLKSNGTRELVPLLPYGDVPARHVLLRGQRIGLYTDKEAADAANDQWGRKLRWPYTVINEGKLARRAFRTTTIVTEKFFDDVFERISAFTPVTGAETFLNGRFAKDPRTGEARVLDDPEGVLVWHSTRVDDAGRVALARLDASLKILWRTELPLSESSTSNPLSTWWLPDRLVVVGTQPVEERGEVTRQVPWLVSIDLASGGVQSVRMTEPGGR